ncbi:hypothetical protein HMY34_07595 [Thiothrix subterranea]|uniref:hypothetical protein n=1 Tax=Thiothrix subterranea TaxID=2735563 RepID=UPI00192C0912|nr:hypothetical protein [Thiothrix subterranea]QQZ28626.1 hypothetical protein HMY34_07595 [Thiothrix subterranea]
MSISSTMTPSTDMAQSIASSTAYNTDSMGTAGQNMDALAAKLYEDVNKGSSNPLIDDLRDLAGNLSAEISGQPQTAPATGGLFDATGSSNTSLEPAPSSPPPANPNIYVDPKTGEKSYVNNGANGYDSTTTTPAPGASGGTASGSKG